jgi:CubicO group peptidase (beta-lactamase class C family)
VSAGRFGDAPLERVHDAMVGYVDRGELPGLVTLVSRRGEVHVDAIGTDSVAGTNAMTRDTIFRISSMTKPVTAVATMMLVEECKLRIDEPVDRLLPELADRRVLKRMDGPIDETTPAERAITVRDLLTFTFGFGLVLAPPGTHPIWDALSDVMLGQGPPNPLGPPEPDEWIRRFGELPLMYQPGERWAYNTGSDVLGVLIARASGRSFDTFLRERIFEPLGMTDTGFSAPDANINRLTTSYMTNFDTGALELFDGPSGQWSRPPAFPSGAGGLVSTVDDFEAFARMLLNGGSLGEERILSRPSVATMTTDHLTPAQKAYGGLAPGYFDDHGWGFGVSPVTRTISPSEPVGRYGWDGGLGTSWFNDPNEDLTAILMTQRAWTSPQPPNVCLDFWSAVYQALDD